MRSLGLTSVALALVVTGTVGAAVTRQPALQVRATAPFTVRGTEFRSAERVAVTLDRTWVRHIRTGPGGTFVTAFAGVVVNRCDGFTVTAAGSKGSRAVLRASPRLLREHEPGVMGKSRSRRPFPCSLVDCRRYGVSLLMRVDQLASAERTPGPWLAPAHVPSRLSPVPPTKNGPPQSV